MLLLTALLAFAATGQEAGDFLVEESGELLEFSYGWPAAVDSEPALRERLRREMEAERAEATGYAEEGRREAAANGFDFNPHYYVKVWQLAGLTPQLLSLQASNETYSGGAHGNIGFAALLWDRSADSPVEAAAVLGARTLERMNPRFCEALDAERAERRGEPVRRDPEDSFTACPPLAELVLAPSDEDGDGRFERLEVLIPPYVAGPYADGPYPLSLPFEAQDLAGIAADYRASFEPGEAASPSAAAAGDADCPSGERDLPRGPGSVCIGRVTDLYAFAFAWPAEAARIAPLDALLREEAAERERWMREQSAVAAAERDEAGAEPMRFTYEEGWTLDVDRPEIAAASGSAWAYTGGAHEGMAYRALLIDRASGRRIGLADLFEDRQAGLAAVQASFCPSLQTAVRIRRGDDSQSVECPAAAEHPVSLVPDEEGTVSGMMALLNPYVVGSWAEGPYDVLFPVTRAIATALKPQYRPAFVLPPE